MKTHNTIYKLILLCVLFFIATPSVAQQMNAPVQPDAQVPVASAYQNATITYHIIDALNGTFGYDVFVDGKLVIHQASIPAMPGNEGFTSREDAIKVAELVMYKIRKGEMPPTVTTDELRDLKVIK